MVQRDHDILIPHGDDCLLPMDNVYFLGTPASLSEMESRANLRVQRKAKKVVIIGAGRIGQALAPMLEAQGLSVKVIDKDRKRCEAMAQKLRKGLVLAGDGTDMDLLTAEGIGEADTVICLTKDERLNMMMALLAKHLGARQTIVRVVRSEYALLMQQVGIDIALSTHILAAGEVLSYIRKGSVVSISYLEGARVQAAEVILQTGAPACGRSLMEARLPKECLVGALVRGEEILIPDGRTVLSAGDRAILIIQADHTDQVLRYFRNGD